jgi:ankyrin repeat protein
MCLAIKKNNLKVTEMLIDWIIKKRNNVDFTFIPNFSIYEDSYVSPFIFKDSYVTPLTVAAIEGKKEIVELLLKKGAKFEFNNKMFQQEPVISALTRHGSKEMIEFIIEKGAKVNVKDWKGITPLMHAVYHGRKDVVELLIKKGANVNEKDYNGKSVLEKATKEINRTIEKMLIENGAKISFKNALTNWRLIPTYFKQN